MYFPQLVSCIKGGLTSADCSHPRLSKSSSTRRSSGSRATEESTRSWRRRQSRTSSKDNESDVDNGQPSSRRRRPRRVGSRLPTTTEEVQAVFQKFDGNGDGKLSWSDLGTLMTSLGCPATDEELRLMISIADSDGDGFIDLSDFVLMNTFSVGKAPNLDDMESAFGIFDFDGNGVISPDELLRVFDSLGHSSSLEDCRSMIVGIDSNGDGSASFDEFLTMMITSPSSA